MKIAKGYNFVSDKELEKLLKRAEKHGCEFGKRDAKKRIESLEKGLERKDKALEIMERDYNDAMIRIEVLEEQRDETREVVKQKIQNEDLNAVLQARQATLEEQTARLKTREEKIGNEEEGEYKRGYADGVADGVRKINEITQKDRDNAMKVAMVAAASHTPVENMKEINGVQGITAGTTDEED